MDKFPPGMICFKCHCEEPSQKCHCEGEPKLRAEGAAAAGDEAIFTYTVFNLASENI